MALTIRFGHFPAHDGPTVVRKQLFLSPHQRDDHFRHGLDVSDLRIAERVAQGVSTLGLCRAAIDSTPSLRRRSAFRNALM